MKQDRYGEQWVTGIRINSLLFVPGSRPERFAKALASGADLVCIDLEDAVAADDKDAARFATIQALAECDRARVAVRINGLATVHGLRDLLAISGSAVDPAMLFVPMVHSACHAEIVRNVLPEQVGIVPLVESTEGLRNAREIARMPGVTAMMFGGGDLAAELGVELAWEPLALARAQFVLACAGHGLGLIDVPFVKLGDEAGLADETRRAKALGFTAKAAIHPAQVAAIREVFSPTQDELAEARASLAAYQAGGGQAVRHNGRMLEAPLIRRFQAMIEQEDARNA